MNRTFWLLLFFLFWAIPAHAQDSPADLYQKGQLERARAAASAESAQGLFVQAMFDLRDAEFDRAAEKLSQAEQLASVYTDKDLITIGRARVMRERGDVRNAELLLREVVQARPQAHLARLELGEILLERGARAEADLVLDAFSTFYNNGLIKTSVDLSLVSRAMAALGSFQDANSAAQKAFEADASNAANLVHWGDLLLAKYNYHDANRTYEDALKAEPNHPGALVGLARIELAESTNYNKVRNLLEEASVLAPGYPPIAITHAQTAIYDSDCTSAREHLQPVLQKRPNHLEALTLVAVCDYLDDETPQFEAKVAEILKLNPRYAEVFSTTAEFAVRVHRYEEAVSLDRRALEILPTHSQSLVGLGIGLSRIGKEDEAVEVFRDAFDADPYNVRAFNMVELYERKMPEYEFTEYDRFRIRAHRTQNDAINHLVAPVVHSALAEFDAKYKTKTDPYLAVEVFPAPDVFSVRSVGVPHVTPQGICFGKVVVSRSPSDGNFNWTQVIWHELAHVYHLQLSNSRVPRWFTEGLAEYETNVKDPAWSRHHDKELARALVAGDLRGVMTLDKGFTQARTMEEILRSYHQASLVIHYLAQTHGFPKIVEMLRAWGAHTKTEDVYQQVLGQTPQQIDDGFRAWLLRRYLHFNGQLLLDFSGIGSVREVSELMRKSPDNAEHVAELAVAQYRDGDKEEAIKSIERALKMGDGVPRVHLIAAVIFVDLDRMKDAHAQGSRVLGLLRDSYDLRILMGAAAQALEHTQEAEIHFEAATQLFPNGEDAWVSLDKIATMTRNEALGQKALARLFALDAHDPVIARRYGERMLKNKNHTEALHAARRWMDIAPFDARAHSFLADTGLSMGKPEVAQQAWEAALAIRPSERREIILEAITKSSKAKQAGLQEHWLERAKAAEIPTHQIQRALDK